MDSLDTEIFIVEFWSNKLYSDPSGVLSHYTSVCHVASSAKGAIEWCNDNDDYGGKFNDAEYYPWHFCVFSSFLNSDEYIQELIYNSNHDKNCKESGDNWDGNTTCACKAGDKKTESLIKKLPSILRGFAEAIDKL